MTHFKSKTLVLSASFALVAAVASPVLGQPAMSSAQCDNMMMVGTQNFAPSAVAGCTAYFQALADGAVATGTFQVVRPQANSGVAVMLSTSGNGG